MGRPRHGRRRGIVKGCECEAKSACFTTWDAATAALRNIPDAERAYRGTCCGHYHVTRLTLDEFAQRVAKFDAERGVQGRSPYGTVVPTTTEEAYDERGEAGAEPGGDACGPRPTSLERGSPDPLAPPSPADVARRLQARRGA